MSKFLKVVVNTLLLLAIVSVGALVVPPFLGITTQVSDGMGNTNLSRGSVTYAKDADLSELSEGDKILVDDASGTYVYSLQSFSSNDTSAVLKNEISGDTTETNLEVPASKVIFTVPVLGFLSMAAQSKEGLIIIGLAVLFLIILFVLSEIWKSNEEEDEEEDYEDYEEDTAGEEYDAAVEEEEPELPVEDEVPSEDEAPEEEEVSEENIMPEEDIETESQPEDETMTFDQEEVEETELEYQPDSADPKIPETEETESEEEPLESLEESINAFTEEELEKAPEEETPQKEMTLPEKAEEEVASEPEPEEEPIELAMPVCTAEELLEKAHAAGDDPKVIEDPETGVTILDYSDIL